MSEGEAFGAFVLRAEAPTGIAYERGSPEDISDPPIRLTVLSEIRFLREALIRALARDEGFRVAGVGRDEVTSAIRSNPPQVLLIDAALADGHGVVCRLRPLAPDTRFVALAIADDEPEVLRWAQAGICGYIHRDAALEDLGAHVRTILQGEQTCSRKVASGLLRWIAGSATAQRPNADLKGVLTKREQEVALLLAAGCSNKEIARRLDVSVGTTKAHVHSVLCKLHLPHRSGVSRVMS